jgi:hypothetical protein
MRGLRRGMQKGRSVVSFSGLGGNLEQPVGFHDLVVAAGRIEFSVDLDEPADPALGNGVLHRLAGLAAPTTTAIAPAGEGATMTAPRRIKGDELRAVLEETASMTAREAVDVLNARGLTPYGRWWDILSMGAWRGRLEIKSGRKSGD